MLSAWHSGIRTLTLLFLTLFLISCSSGATVEEVATRAPEPTAVATAKPTTPPFKPEGTLIISLTTRPNILDTTNSSERQAHNASLPLYDSLVWTNDSNQKVPALAASWSISADGLEYTFNLRDDVTFHNGEPFNADSVLFSWERGQQEGNTYANQWERADSVTVVDDYTVKITTPEPDPLFLSFMVERWAMLPPIHFQEVGEEAFFQHPIGTGPFMFESWEGDTLTYTANPNYWQAELPKVETLIFRTISEPEERIAALQAGEIDIAARLKPENASSLLNLPDIQTIRYSVDRTYYIAFNNLTTGVGEPTEDPVVRQAMNYAIDRQTIIDTLFQGYGRLSTGLITPGNIGYDYTIEAYSYDPEKARSLLTAAGYPDGFTIGFACPTEAYANFEEVCAKVQTDLAAVGITADLELMDSGPYWDLEAEKKLPPLFGDSWSESSGEALPRLMGALGGENASYSSWSEEEIDRLLAQISVTVNEVDRANLYSELQQYMFENPPFIYLYEPITFEAVNQRVQNYQPRAAENYFLHEVYVE